MPPLPRSARAYYNENEPATCEWLRELVNRNLLPSGVVDERDIRSILSKDVLGYRQAHFFTGIGGWPYALTLAHWPKDQSIWTGSCPCQPFSTAGKRQGFDDERHLWPTWFNLIRECRPECIVGEQVASKDGLAWFDVVRSDLEGAGYTVGCVDTCAAGFGAPHLRQRLYWVAYSTGVRFVKRGNAKTTALQRECPKRDGEQTQPQDDRELSGRLEGLRSDGELADLSGERLERSTRTKLFGGSIRPTSDGITGDVDDFVELSEEERVTNHSGKMVRLSESKGFSVSGATNGFWANAEWLPCRDGKRRAVEPGTPPLADGVPARVVKLRGYGNAIVIPQAVEFIKAVTSVLFGRA